MRIITQEDNKDVIKINQDEQFIIKLPENVTTGYRWNIQESKNIIKLADSWDMQDTELLAKGLPKEHLPSHVSTSLVGGGTERIILFQLNNEAEEGILELKYSRPFSPNDSDETFKIKIMV